MARKIPETITEEELLKLLKEVKLKHHKLAFALGFYQCLRVGEVVKLMPEHVDLKRHIIMVKEGKGKKDRNIPINQNITRMLGHLPIKCGVRALQIAFKEYSKRVLGKNLHFHTLRHSGATYYHNARKWDVRHVQQFLGHSNLDTTQIYTHVNPQDLAKLMGWEE